MTSTKTTLDYLVSAQHKQEPQTINIEHTNKNTNKKHHPHHHTKKERLPPVIPPSPSIKPDDLVTLQTDLLLRKFELDALHQSWLDNTVQSEQFQNASSIHTQLTRFALQQPKHQYQSLIKHSNLPKSRITELVQDGQAMHIVTQFTDVGCPTVKNPNTKKGCWCIEEIKKQKKSHQLLQAQQQQQQQQQRMNHHLHSAHLHHSHHFQPLMHGKHGNSHNNNHNHTHLSHPAVLLKQNVLHSHTQKAAPMTSNNASNSSLAVLSIQQYFKHFNVANQTVSSVQPSSHRLLNATQTATATATATANAKGKTGSTALSKVVNVCNPSYASLSKHSSPHNNTHTNINTARNKAAAACSSTMGMIQNNLISNARTQHYTPSNRMQQIRMQQMLLTARTQPVESQNSVGGQLTTTTTMKMKMKTNSASNGALNDKKRQHKDTIVFDSKVGEPLMKKRKKSRWSSK